MNGQVIIATITTFVAVIGLIASVVFNFLGRRDALHQVQRNSLHESSKRLVAPAPAERALGMATTVDYLLDPAVGGSARRIALTALHYEAEPLVFRSGIEALREAGLARQVIDELIPMNRQLWADLLEGFSEAIGQGEEGETQGQEVNSASIVRDLAALRRNQKVVSQLLRSCSLDQLDFSDGFFPELSASGSMFSDCNFSSTFLHYANFRGAHFTRCNFTKAILIGSYLEGAHFTNCSFTNMVAIAARLHHRATTNHSDLPVELLTSSQEPCSSFLYEVEQDWHGHWLGRGSPRGDFQAQWWDLSGQQVTAVITATSTGFKRSESSDANDGSYRVTRRDRLDPHRYILLVGGVRTLASHVAGRWRGVWWRQLGPRGTARQQTEIRGVNT
jgi:hypothetical protein